MANIFLSTVFMLLTQISLSVHSFIQWDHAVDTNEDYRLLWRVKDQDITFEVQVRTLGYVGFGFSRDGSIYGADVVVGWVDQGHTYFQVSIVTHYFEIFSYPLLYNNNKKIIAMVKISR